MFLAEAVVRLSRGGGISHPQARTWLFISAIFTLVTAWLWFFTRARTVVVTVAGG